MQNTICKNTVHFITYYNFRNAFKCIRFCLKAQRLQDFRQKCVDDVYMRFHVRSNTAGHKLWMCLGSDLVHNTLDLASVPQRQSLAKPSTAWSRSFIRHVKWLKHMV